MKPQYPKMLYKDGSDTTDYVIVADPGEQAAAAKEGYFPHGEKPESEEVKRGPGRPKKAA